MHKGVACKPGSPTFPNGTTNGAGWYPLIGGAQDYSYVWAGTMEITVEMSCCKYPPAAELPNHWLEHRQVGSKRFIFLTSLRLLNQCRTDGFISENGTIRRVL